MFLEKYKPKTISEMIGNRLQANELKRSISEWKRGYGIVLSGSPGCGKTLAIELVAKEFGLEIVTGSLDELKAASVQSSIWSRGKILVGDIDTDVSADDAAKLMEISGWPVVFVTTDIYQNNLKVMRKDPNIWVISFQKVYPAELASALKRICSVEGIACDERALYDLAQCSDGDVRWALISLESLKRVESSELRELDKDRIEKMFDTLDRVFQRRHSSGDADVSSLFGWIVENLPERYSGNELAQAYRCIAAASRFQRFGMDAYFIEMIGLMPSSRISAQYKFPRWIGADAKVTGVHCSAKKAKAYGQVMNIINSVSAKSECDKDD